MKKKKIYYVIIIILIIIITIIFGFIIAKKIKLKNDNFPPAEEIKKYNGKISCLKEITIDNDYYQQYDLQEAIVVDDIVTENNFLSKIVYKDSDNYEGFKNNEKVNNPIYDDKNLTIIYTRDEKINLEKDQKNFQDFIKETEQNGYTCSMES